MKDEGSSWYNEQMTIKKRIKYALWEGIQNID